MTSQTDLTRQARELFRLLSEQNLRIIFAESCTGGLVSAAMTTIAGVSDVHCGSAVVYRVETKAQWLGISRDVLSDPGPVSETVARQMASKVLEKTPEAHISASITGHLGPDAPEGQEGLTFLGLAVRNGSEKSEDFQTRAREHWLEKPKDEPAMNGDALREERQRMAAQAVLATVCRFLQVEADRE